MSGVKDRVALISGSSRGIGRGIARTLLSGGARVVLTGRDPDRLDQTAAELHAAVPSGELCTVATDLRTTASIRDCLDRVASHYGAPAQIVVANLGSGRAQTGWDLEDKEWQRVLELNLLSAERLCREAIRDLTTAELPGSLIAISSIAGIESIGAPTPYAVAKAGLLAYVKATADQVARHGIRLNAVSPGNVYFEGGTWHQKLAEDPDGVRSMLQQRVPMQDFGSCEDIGAAVAFLASDEARFITGTNLAVDGGQLRGLVG